MRLVQVLIVKLNQLHTLILLQSGELFELLSEKEIAEFHWSVLSIIVEALTNLLLPLTVLIDDLPLL